MGIVNGGDSYDCQKCGEIDHSGQYLLTHNNPGTMLETHQQSVPRMEMDEGYQTVDSPHSIPLFSKQNISGGVITDRLAIPGSIPGNTVTKPGPTQKTELNSPTLIMGHASGLQPMRRIHGSC